jgi:hypothetical protein
MTSYEALAMLLSQSYASFYFIELVCFLGMSLTRIKSLIVVVLPKVPKQSWLWCLSLEFFPTVTTL